MITTAAPLWDFEFARRSPIFAPLRPVADKLPQIGWPNVEVLNHVAFETERRIVNARGQRIWFVPAAARAREEPGFEPAVYLAGQVQVRPVNWHDLFNALVWMTFPTAKAAINGRHQQVIEEEAGGARSPVRDALTHFDEDGVVVLSADAQLSALLRAFAWKDLFWLHRDAVKRAMRFLVFGHALYDKARAPFIGLTGKALIFDVGADALALERDRLRAHVDRMVALYVLDPANLSTPKVLQPLPLLGVPGWWKANEAPSFYDNTEYFRPGRRG
ncbi:MAG TPA: DUF3025 domain-containing protein [Burkholderiales bacterium]|nr:DUF3025 domain-containing protein [Burkholderiales bacterium]